MCVHCVLLQLNKVGLKTDEEKRAELCLSRSHEELFDSRIAENSPTISKKGSKNRGGGFFKLFKRKTVMTRGKQGGEREKEPVEDGEGSADEAETHSNKGSFVSYLPSSFSMPNIACEFYCVHVHVHVGNTHNTCIGSICTIQGRLNRGLFRELMQHKCACIQSNTTSCTCIYELSIVIHEHVHYM